MEQYFDYPGYPLVSFGPASGDTLVPAADDGSGLPINFTTPFPFLRSNERVIICKRLHRVACTMVIKLTDSKSHQSVDIPHTE